MIHDYVPKPKKRILVLVETSRTFGCQIIEGISRYALEQKEWLLILEDRGPNDPAPAILRRTPCDGIISRTASRPMTNALYSHIVPTVELLGDGEVLRPDIQPDYAAVAKEAFIHFQDRGLCNFAYFSVGHCWWSRELSESFRSLCDAFDRTCHTAPTEASENSVLLPIDLDIHAEKIVARWLQSLPKPVGILCPEDAHAIGLLNICRMNQISIPFEVAVLGLGNNTVLCNATTPRLSSIAINGSDIGYMAARHLDQKIRSPRSKFTKEKVGPLYIATRLSTNFTVVEDEDVRQALQYASDHLAEHFTLEHMAQYLNISKRSLIRRFNESLGHPPEKEIMRIRLNRAQELLIETDMSIGKIADALGYKASEYFIRVFQQHFGMTPKQFREKVRGA